MELFFAQLTQETEQVLSALENETGGTKQKAKEACMILQLACKKLDNYTARYTFESAEEEVDFFKIKKPSLTWKLIYYRQIFRIENYTPHGSPEVKKRFFASELDKITQDFEANAHFISYLRSGETSLDHLYFRKDNADFKLSNDAFLTSVNALNFISYDILAAKILANDQLQVYLTDCIRKIDSELTRIPEVIKTFRWTESKAALIEFIYALHSTGAIDDGKADIKDIARYCERLFNVELGDIYRTFLELRMRKGGRSKFIDLMREGLLKRMDEHDHK